MEGKTVLFFIKGIVFKRLVVTLEQKRVRYYSLSKYLLGIHEVLFVKVQEGIDLEACLQLSFAVK